MKTRATVLGVLASIGVLAVGLEVGASAGASSTTTSATGTTTTTTTTTASSDGSGTTSTGLDTSGSSTTASSTPSSTPSTTPTATAAGSSTVKDGTYTGAVESTRFGDVQVSVTIASGKITNVTALKLTDREQRSVQISNQAAPLLKAEVLKAQSAKVSSIGGATYTSGGYLSSLQAALDTAGF